MHMTVDDRNPASEASCATPHAERPAHTHGAEPSLLELCAARAGGAHARAPWTGASSDLSDARVAREAREAVGPLVTQHFKHSTSLLELLAARAGEAHVGAGATLAGASSDLADAGFLRETRDAYGPLDARRAYQDMSLREMRVARETEGQSAGARCS
jgi:hypothetical protein